MLHLATEFVIEIEGKRTERLGPRLPIRFLLGTFQKDVNEVVLQQRERKKDFAIKLPSAIKRFMQKSINVVLQTHPNL